MPSKFSDRDRRQMRELYEAGFSQQAIGERFGTHGTYVGNILRDLGVTARFPKAGPALLTGDQCDEIRALHTSGARQVDLAKRFGVSQAVISRVTRQSYRRSA